MTVTPLRSLIVTSTPRSGSTLLCQVLSAHPALVVAADPFLPLFRAFRDAALRQAGFDADPRLPFQDHYFTGERIRRMDALQAADLGIAFEAGDDPRFLEAWAERMGHECADLVPHLARLRGSTYGDVLERGFRLIAEVRDATGRAWVGFKDVWIVELFATLARAYPDAKFIILVRDPRAVVASMHAIDRVDASQVAHTLSYARHWRKYVAFAVRYQSDPLFAGRIRTVRYEDLVMRPEEVAGDLCEFLGVPFAARMLKTRSYRDHSSGREWRGNSSYADPLSGISAEQVERWQSTLERDALELVELVCGPDMRLFGYESVVADDEVRRSPAALAYLIRNGARPTSWRSDLGDPQLDHGFELFRRALIDLRGPIDAGLVRRSFLFPEAYEAIRDPEVMQRTWPRTSVSSN